MKRISKALSMLPNGQRLLVLQHENIFELPLYFYCLGFYLNTYMSFLIKKKPQIFVHKAVFNATG